MATMLGPRFKRRWATRASTSTVPFSGARACWIVPKLRLWPSQIKPPPSSSTRGPVISLGSTLVMLRSSHWIEEMVQ